MLIGVGGLRGQAMRGGEQGPEGPGLVLLRAPPPEPPHPHSERFLKNVASCIWGLSEWRLRRADSPAGEGARGPQTSSGEGP